MKGTRKVFAGLVAGFIGTLLPAVARAEEAGGGDGDYRSRVYTACTLVFACIIAYLVLSHRRNARVREDVEFLDRRLKELDGKK